MITKIMLLSFRIEFVLFIFSDQASGVPVQIKKMRGFGSAKGYSTPRIVKPRQRRHHNNEQNASPGTDCLRHWIYKSNLLLKTNGLDLGMTIRSTSSFQRTP